MKTKFKIRDIELSNRIVMPPMVTFGYGINDGVPSDSMIDHYADRAKGGVGLIIVEATGINPTAVLSHKAIGIWDDVQAERHKGLTARVHEYNVPVLLQLNHAGVKGVNGESMGPSDFNGFIYRKHYSARSMTKDEISKIKEDFVKSARRAIDSGYDGIELHCAHSYLLCDFLSPIANKRMDAYGLGFDGRMKLPMEIVSDIRKEIGSKVISVRMGYNEPDLNTSIEIAKRFESVGVDLLHISTGFGSSGFMSEPEMDSAPENFPFNIRVWGAKEIKKHVNCPVVAVGGIRQAQQAQKILSAQIADLIAVGRGLLCDPEWVNKIENGIEIAYCRNCAGCVWSRDYTMCPGRRTYQAMIGGGSI